MRKILLCLLLTNLLAVTVFADVLIEIDDSFWEKHQSECEYLYRAYTVNGPEGYAAIWESPLSSRQKETVLNGTEVSGIWHYTDKTDEVWCAVYGEGRTEKGEKIRGWIKTSECIAVPDYISFEEAHSAEFVGYDAAYDHAFDEVPYVVLWTYPGSGVIEAEDIDAEWFLREVRTLVPCWRDYQGRMWGFVSYCYGIRNTWVCLDDPANRELGKDEQVLSEDTVIYPAAGTLPPPSNGVSGLTIASVAAVIAVTIGLLIVFFIKKRPNFRADAHR